MLHNLLKKIYLVVPFKQNVFKLIRGLNLHERIYRHLTFYGFFRVKTPSGFFEFYHFGHQIENEIFWEGLTGGWEGESMQLWLKLCSNANVVFDIGANTGLYSLSAKAENENSDVYSFEPVLRVYEKLKINIDRNKFSDIHAFQLGLSNYSGKASIYDPGGDHVLSVSVNRNLTELELDETVIEVRRMDDFIIDKGISGIDIIKLDVEYHEPEVLEGMGDYLNEFLPTILIEVLTDDIAYSLNEIVNGLGYRYFNVDESDGVTEVRSIVKSSSFNILLLSPKHVHWIL